MRPVENESVGETPLAVGGPEAYPPMAIIRRFGW